MTEIRISSVDIYRGEPHPVLEPLWLPQHYYHSAYSIGEKMAVLSLENAISHRPPDSEARSEITAQIQRLTELARNSFSLKGHNQGGFQLFEEVIKTVTGPYLTTDVFESRFRGFRRPLSPDEMTELAGKLQEEIANIPFIDVGQLEDPSMVRGRVMLGSEGRKQDRSLKIMSADEAKAEIYQALRPLGRILEYVHSDESTLKKELMEVVEDAKKWRREKKNLEAWRIKEARIPELKRRSAENDARMRQLYEEDKKLRETIDEVAGIDAAGIRNADINKMKTDSIPKPHDANGDSPRNFWFIGIACAGLGGIAFLALKMKSMRRKVV